MGFSLLKLGNKSSTRKETTELVPVKKQESTEITVTNGVRGHIVQVRPKEISCGGQKRHVDPYQLMGMIKSITQTIGEYKNLDNAFADFATSGLRKTRRDMVSQLEEHFKIHWAIGEDGRSVFYL